MTKSYIENACALNKNEAFDGTEDLEGFRKGLVTELFLLFFVYFISQMVHTFRYKN